MYNNSCAAIKNFVSLSCNNLRTRRRRTNFIANITCSDNRSNITKNLDVGNDCVCWLRKLTNCRAVASRSVYSNTRGITYMLNVFVCYNACRGDIKDIRLRTRSSIDINNLKTVLGTDGSIKSCVSPLASSLREINPRIFVSVCLDSR